MTDAAFLRWLRNRLIHVYRESPHADFVERLEAIATTLDTGTERVQAASGTLLDVFQHED